MANAGSQLIYEPTLGEQAYSLYLAQHVFQILPNRPLHISGRSAVPFLTRSGVDRGTLRSMWTVADPENLGTLTQLSQFQVLLRLVSLAQAGMLPIQGTAEDMKLVIQQSAGRAFALPFFSSITAPPQATLLDMYRPFLVHYDGAPQPDAFGFGVQRVASIDDAFADLGPVENAPLGSEFGLPSSLGGSEIQPPPSVTDSTETPTRQKDTSLNTIPLATETPQVEANINTHQNPDPTVVSNNEGDDDDEFGDFEAVNVTSPAAETRVDEAGGGTNSGEDGGFLDQQPFGQNATNTSIGSPDFGGGLETMLSGGSDPPNTAIQAPDSDPFGAISPTTDMPLPSMNKNGSFDNDNAAGSTHVDTTEDDGFGGFETAEAPSPGLVPGLTTTTTSVLSVTDAFNEVGVSSIPPLDQQNSTGNVNSSALATPEEEDEDEDDFGGFEEAAVPVALQDGGPAPSDPISSIPPVLPSVAPGIPAALSFEKTGNSWANGAREVSALTQVSDPGDPFSAFDSISEPVQPEIALPSAALSDPGVPVQTQPNIVGEDQSGSFLPEPQPTTDVQSNENDIFGAFNAVPSSGSPELVTSSANNGGSITMSSEMSMHRESNSAPSDSEKGLPSLGNHAFSSQQKTSDVAGNDDPFSAFDSIPTPTINDQEDQTQDFVGFSSAPSQPGSFDFSDGGISQTSAPHQNGIEYSTNEATQLAADDDDFGDLNSAPTNPAYPPPGGDEPDDVLASASSDPTGQDDDFGDFESTPAQMDGINASPSGDPFSAFDSIPVPEGPEQSLEKDPSTRSQELTPDTFTTTTATQLNPEGSVVDAFSSLDNAMPKPLPNEGTDDSFGDFDAAPIQSLESNHFSSLDTVPVSSASEEGPLETNNFDNLQGQSSQQTQLGSISKETSISASSQPGNASLDAFGSFDATVPAAADDDFSGFNSAPVYATDDPSTAQDPFSAFDAIPNSQPPGLSQPTPDMVESSAPVPTDLENDNVDSTPPDNDPINPSGADDDFGDFGSAQVQSAEADLLVQDPFAGFDTMPATSAPEQLSDGEMFDAFQGSLQNTAPAVEVTDAAPSKMEDRADDDFGSFDAAPTKSSVVEDDDDFGDFDTAPEPSTESHVVTEDPFDAFAAIPTSDGAGGPLESGDFDSFAGSQAPSLNHAPQLSMNDPSHLQNGSQGDFGLFDTFTTKPTPTESSSIDGFGAFDAPPQSAEASSTPEDPFGDFDNLPPSGSGEVLPTGGSLDIPPGPDAAANSVTPPSLPVDGDDDDFGDFDTATIPFEDSNVAASPAPKDGTLGDINAAPPRTGQTSASIEAFNTQFPSNSGDEFADFQTGPAPASGVPAIAKDIFQNVTTAVGDDDFGNFGSATGNGNGDDDFGKFESTVPQSEAQQDMDDDWGDFGAASIPENTAPKAATDDFAAFASTNGESDDDDGGDWGDFENVEAPHGNTSFPSENSQQVRIRELSMPLSENILRKNGGKDGYVDLGECFEVNIGLDTPLEGATKIRVDRAIQIIEILSRMHRHHASSYWEQVLGVIKDDLTTGNAVLLEGKRLSSSEKNELLPALRTMVSGFAEYIRITRLIVATIGDMLMLETSTLLTIDTWTSTWFSLSILSVALDIETQWKSMRAEVQSQFPALLPIADAPLLQEIRRQTSSLSSISENLCELTLRPLKSTDKSTTEAPVSWHGSKFMACSANLLANRCPFYVVEE